MPLSIEVPTMFAIFILIYAVMATCKILSQAFKIIDIKNGVRDNRRADASKHKTIMKIKAWFIIHFRRYRIYEYATGYSAKDRHYVAQYRDIWDKRWNDFDSSYKLNLLNKSVATYKENIEKLNRNIIKSNKVISKI